jgi:hypothetical protein
VLVDRHPAVYRQPEDQRRFTQDDWVGGHKITVTTRPEMHGIETSVGR